MSINNSFFNKIFPPVLVVLMGSALWEALSYWNIINAYLIPAPHLVIQSLCTDFSEFKEGFLSTLICAASGFLMSAVIGIFIALILISSDFLKRAFYPFAVFFQTVPIVAIAPLLVIWFGFGKPSVIASAFIVSVFPMVATSLAGFFTVEPALLDLFRLYGAGRLSTLFKLIIPFSLPHIFSGLRIVAGLSVIGTIVGEFISGGGLGGIIDVARTQQRVDKVFAAVLLCSALGLFAIALVDLLNRSLVRDRQS